MPEPTSENRCEGFAEMRKRILQNINNLKELVVILKSLRTDEDLSMEDKVDLMLTVFATESKTPKYDLITYLWNFLKILYNKMDKLIVRLIPAIGIDRGMELTDKHVILYKEITTRMYYVMVYMKDTTPENVEVMCRNVLLLSKYLMKEGNYMEFFNLAKDTFFNPKHMYQLKIFNEPSPANDLFLEHYLTRLWEFRDVKDQDLTAKGLKIDDLYEKFFQIFIFFVNYEAKNEESKYKLTDKLVSVLLNMNLSKASKDICNSIKCLYSLVQVMKADDGQEVASKGLLQYMTRICDKTVLSTFPVAADTLATVAVILEKSPFFVDESNFKRISGESMRNLLQAIKLTGSLNVEPVKFVCEMKDCAKGSKKHTVTNLTRFAQKIFVAYVSQLGENEPIDEDILVIVTQLVIFHFHVLDRLQCTSRIANEHNDVRRLYSAFAHRSKSNPHASILKIFEILLKYVLQRNLPPLVNPLATLLAKYYSEANDQANGNRIDWLNFVSLNGDSSQCVAFNHFSYNWAVKRQMLSKEEILPVLKSMCGIRLDYQTEIIPKNVDAMAVFSNILESIASLNLKAFRAVQEAFVEIIMDQKSTECSLDMVNLLFYATESQVLDYKEAIEGNRDFFEKQPEKNVTNAVLHSLTYQVYIAELRKDLKSVDINVMHNRELDLSVLSVQRDNKAAENLKKSLEELETISTVKRMTPRDTRQIVGTLKRNIRFFQLTGMEFEEVSACKLLYQFGKELKDAESCLLAMANLVNHVHFIIKDPKCRSTFPNLIRLITGEGSNLITMHLKTLPEAKESLQTLIVFGMGNLIKLNADLGRRDKCYDYLEYLKLKIDAIVKDKDEPGVADMQYNLINYQLFLKYSQKSKVNHMLVARELFSAVRLLHKASDLYALYLYDVLVELFCFAVPRYETKGLDYYICIVLKYYMGLGSVTRILDVLLIYSNWALCCEAMDKCLPAMEYISEILARTGKEARKEQLLPKKNEKGVAETKTVDEELSLQRITEASKAATTMSRDDSVRLAVVGFKLNCLLARKHYVDRSYEQSKRLYENAWKAYEELNDRIASYSLKTEFQQFYVNVLFQLSNVYFKLGLSAKSLQFCEATTLLISDIRVNRIALTQEAYFQGMIFKSETSAVITTKGKESRKQSVRKQSPVSPIQMEMAMIMNEKKATGSRSTKKKILPPQRKEGSRRSSTEKTPSKRNRKGRLSNKGVKIKIESPDVLPMPPMPVVDENSSVLGNMVTAGVVVIKQEETGGKKTAAKKIPVRATKVTAKTLPSALPKLKTGSLKSSEEAGVTATTTTTAVGTRKTSRRLI